VRELGAVLPSKITTAAAHALPNTKRTVLSRMPKLPPSVFLSEASAARRPNTKPTAPAAAATTGKAMPWRPIASLCVRVALLLLLLLLLLPRAAGRMRVYRVLGSWYLTLIV
jgi:hypothetical protein